MIGAMVGTISDVLYAALAFVGLHILSSTPLRAAIVRAVGQGPYMGLFSLASFALIGWLCWAYANAPFVPVWDPAPWTRHIPYAVMPFAFILLTTGYFTPNPTAVMQDAALQADQPARGIMRITRHPIMWAIALWALSHLTTNGDAASIILFGALALLALVGTKLIDWKKEEQMGAAFGPLALTTSVIPFAAAIEGRTTIDWAEIGWWKVLAGLVLYAAFILLHGWIIGVPIVAV